MSPGRRGHSGSASRTVRRRSPASTLEWEPGAGPQPVVPVDGEEAGAENQRQSQVELPAGFQILARARCHTGCRPPDHCNRERRSGQTQRRRCSVHLVEDAVVRGSTSGKGDPEGLPQCVKLVRFLDEAGRAFAVEARRHFLLVVSAGHDHRHVRGGLVHRPECLLPVHLGHGQIHQHGPQLRPVPVEQAQGLAAVAGGDHPETDGFDHPPRHVPHGRFILRQEDQP